jgi:threonine dehydrogenase-like Zn-dependent dehydrogenase
MAEYLTLPVENLHMVPEALTDQEACFAEPLAAACRIAEQQVCMLPTEAN